MNAAAPLFAAERLSKTYRRGSAAEVAALADVSLAVPRGSFLAVTGPSGGGKSTLLAMLGALDRPTAGLVRFEGESLEDLSDAARARLRRRIGLVFQGSPTIRGLPVWENVTYPLIPLGVPARERRARAAALLGSLGLAAAIDKRSEELSGGEVQRVGIARALVADPVALLADEPTSNLDRRSSEAIAVLLAKIHASGVTVVVATHDPVLIALATSSVELDGGRLRPGSPPLR